MFSLQHWISRDERIFELLEASATHGRASVESLIQLLKHRESSLTPFVEARRREKQINHEIRDHLVERFVLPMDREDIETLAMALYKIPKSVEKFSERYLISSDFAQGTDFSHQMEMLNRASQLVVSLVQGLRSGLELEKASEENAELQRIEGEADKLMLYSLRNVYEQKDSGLRALALKDLHELLERVFDRCRDAGNAVFMTALKHS